MQKMKLLGIATLTLALSITPVQAYASTTQSCPNPSTRKMIVLNGSCDQSALREKLQCILNGTTGNDSTNSGNSTEDSTSLSYAKQVVALVNAERSKAGLSPLALDTKITTAANVRAAEIQSSFSHTRPNGTNCATVLKEHNISYRGYGENIAYGQKTPEQVVKGWMNSSGHRANILNSKFTKIGVGYQQNSRSTPYWVQLFTY